MEIHAIFFNRIFHQLQKIMANTLANGIRIEYEDMGDPNGTPIMLVMGLGAQLILWPEDFCKSLVDEGIFKPF